MKFIIVTEKWLSNKGLVAPEHARKSLDGTKILLHKDFVEPVLTSDDEIEEYSFDSQELRDILNSSEWVEEMEGEKP